MNKFYWFPAKQEEILFFPAIYGFTSEFYLEIKINECKSTLLNKVNYEKIEENFQTYIVMNQLAPYWDDTPINQEQRSSERNNGRS